MDRKEFLNILIQKYIKPFLLICILSILSILIFSILFSNNEIKISIISFISFLILSLIIIFIVIYFVSNFTKKIKNIILRKLNDNALHQLSVLNKIVDYLLPIFYGIVIYYAYQKDKLSSITFFGVYLLIKIRDIIKQENIKIKNT
jgi:hypothetical protein